MCCGGQKGCFGVTPIHNGPDCVRFPTCRSHNPGLTELGRPVPAARTKGAGTVQETEWTDLRQPSPCAVAPGSRRQGRRSQSLVSRNSVSLLLLDWPLSPHRPRRSSREGSFGPLNRQASARRYANCPEVRSPRGDWTASDRATRDTCDQPLHPETWAVGVDPDTQRIRATSRLAGRHVRWVHRRLRVRAGRSESLTRPAHVLTRQHRTQHGPHGSANEK